MRLRLRTLHIFPTKPQIQSLPYDLEPTIASTPIGGEAPMPLRVKAKFYFCLKGLTLRILGPLDEIEFGTHLNKVQSKLTELVEKAQ